MSLVWGSSLTYSRLPLAQAIAALVADGFDTVELGVLEGWAHVSPAALVEQGDSLAQAVRRTLEAAGARVAALNAGLGAAEADADERGRRAAAVFGLARVLGAGVVTLPAGPAGAGVDAAAARLRPLLEAAKHAGVTLAVETHVGALTEDPAAAAALCLAVPGLRLTLDPSHYWAGPARGGGWEAVLPHVAHVHLRDAGSGGWGEIQVWPGRGQVDFPRVVGGLRSLGYRGGWTEEYIDTLPVVGGGDAAAAARAMRDWAAPWLG